jgi:hypothetical protein
MSPQTIKEVLTEQRKDENKKSKSSRLQGMTSSTHSRKSETAKGSKMPKLLK